MTATGLLNFAWSQALVAGFAAAGVSHAVMSPGSRSTPLALALLRRPEIATEVILDERSAAFFALGLAKASGRPVLVLATSGTAPANWLPAVIEASQAGVPLILIAADRPPELQACGANQTIDQANLFTPHVRARHLLAAPHPDFAPAWLHALAAQVVEETLWPLPGPVHINQPFREPLLPAEPAAPPLLPAAIGQDRAPLPPTPRSLGLLATRLSGRPGAIVCGEADYPPGFAEAVAALAGRLDCPILAEPLSGLRFGPHDRSRILCRYEGWLRHPDFAKARQPQWLLRFGAFPVTRVLQDFVSASRDTLALVDPLPRWLDPSHRATQVLRADPERLCRDLLAEELAPCPPDWMEAFRAAEAGALAALPGRESPEAAFIPTLLAALPAGCALFVGNSMAIRDMDAFSGSGAKPLTFYANRGASGIDGNVSAALGIAAAHGRVVALLGDLSCQHDVGGLAAAAGHAGIFVIFNNGGGGIFEYLPQAGLPEFQRGWLTPQAMDFAAAAAAFRLDYARVADPGRLAACLEPLLASGRSALVEIPIDRALSVARRRAWLEAVATAPL